jgi:hypothetical protein
MLGRPDIDRRLAWTRCGVRFMWGSLPKGQPGGTGRCQACWTAKDAARPADGKEGA